MLSGLSPALRLSVCLGRGVEPPQLGAVVRGSCRRHTSMFRTTRQIQHMCSKLLILTLVLSLHPLVCFLDVEQVVFAA